MSPLLGLVHSILNVGPWEYLGIPLLFEIIPQKEPNSHFSAKPEYVKEAAPRSSAAEDAASLPFSVPSAQLVCDDSLVRSPFYCTRG